MFELLNFFGLIIHFAVLAGGIGYVCQRLRLPRYDWPVVIYLAVWMVLVLAAHITSLFNALDNLLIYNLVSLGVLAAVMTLLWFCGAVKGVALLQRPQLEFALIDNPKIRKFLWIALGLTLVYVACASILLGNLVYPDNADSMIYRLPRAYWYVSQGNLLHPFASEDSRITFYPLNGTSIYFPMVLYQVPGTILSYPSLLTWAMVVYVTYRFARELGAEKLLALFAAWLVGMTPGILAQATSTNDEILAAAALLCGMLLFWRWLIEPRPLYFIMAISAIGLSAATKPHMVFLLPFFACLLIYTLIKVSRRPVLLQQWWEAIGWRTAILALCGMAVMFVPFLIYNQLSSGKLTHSNEFVSDVFNLSSNLQTIWQNFIIYLSQMALSPIADLNAWPVANERQMFNTALNEIFNPLIKPLLSDDPHYYHFNYRFVGITIPTSVRFVEFSLWSGYVWMLWPLQATLAARQKFPLRIPFMLIALIPALWLFFWCLTTLYMEGTATYFTFYLICAAPAAIFAFAKIAHGLRNELRWIMLCLVAVTSLVIANNMLMFSGFRSLPDLFYAKRLPFDWNLASQTIIDEIRRAKRIRIIFTHEKMPYFAYMHWNPAAKYYSPYPLQSLEKFEDVLQIYPASSIYQYGFMPIKLPGKQTPGMTYLGVNRAIGREAIFATGNNVHLRHPQESDYVVPQLLYRPVGNDFEIYTRPEFAGLRPEDNIEWKFVLTQGDRTLFARDWDKRTDFSTLVPNDFSLYDNKLTISARQADSKRELATVTYPALVPGAWLADNGEYE